MIIIIPTKPKTAKRKVKKAQIQLASPCKSTYYLHPFPQFPSTIAIMFFYPTCKTTYLTYFTCRSQEPQPAHALYPIYRLACSNPSQARPVAGPRRPPKLFGQSLRTSRRQPRPSLYQWSIRRFTQGIEEQWNKVTIILFYKITHSKIFYCSCGTLFSMGTLKGHCFLLYIEIYFYHQQQPEVRGPIL